jgi:chemotaxis protein CheD
MTEISEHFLFPSTIHVSEIPCRVTTILGSCVAVCMWDKRKLIGGINHYMLPLWNGNGLATPKYGDIAIERLYKKMLSLGCVRSNLIIKVTGGAEVLDTKKGYYAIPERNIDIAIKKLKELDLKIAHRTTGGFNGRKVIFETHTGIIKVITIPRRTNNKIK